MAKRKIRNAVKRHKVVTSIIVVLLVPVLLLVFWFSFAAIKYYTFDAIYYPYQEKRFNVKNRVELIEGVSLYVSSDSPDVTVKVQSDDGVSYGSFRGVRKNWRTEVGEHYTIVIKNNTDRWITAHIDYSDDTCSPIC
ncbi:hypothetical protein OZX67_02740 [Bifidobacterium sp. ESL0728]|uniref:hypothetical protein n=1 Tax=Bifidobacterium sp. ESL0728 TaxID=2983220 RepID=UPI0023F77BE2|nr:hypothetical protein [Bifidobacterium sp. ESL0728]WEV59483.1 hypothetical protein OZX67_02740 [Bifidobacterium sp. ESL0728]